MVEFLKIRYKTISRFHDLSCVLKCSAISMQIFRFQTYAVAENGLHPNHTQTYSQKKETNRVSTFKETFINDTNCLANEINFFAGFLVSLMFCILLWQRKHLSLFSAQLKPIIDTPKLKFFNILQEEFFSTADYHVVSFFKLPYLYTAPNARQN